MNRNFWLSLMVGLGAGLLAYRLALLRARRRMADDVTRGRGRADVVLRTGVYPASARRAPADAQAQGMGDWGAGPAGNGFARG